MAQPPPSVLTLAQRSLVRHAGDDEGAAAYLAFLLTTQFRGSGAEAAAELRRLGRFFTAAAGLAGAGGGAQPA